MKSLKAIGKNVLLKIFPEIVEFGFKAKTEFFDNTIDIHRRFENLYKNIAKNHREKNPEIEIPVLSLKFEVWGMELGRVDTQVVGVTSSKDQLLPVVSPGEAFNKNLIDIICNCDRIKQTMFAPTHLIVVIDTQGKKWARKYREIYLLEKWQSEEILNKSHE